MAQEPFSEIPLFKELQRLLSSSSGPINLEIAGQIARSLATQGGPDTRPRDEITRSHADAVRNAELLLSGYTGLAITEPARTDVLTRSAWIAHSIDSWRWLLEGLALRFTAGFENAGAGEEGGALGGAGAVLQQVGPLLSGLQAGTMLGHLSTEVLTRYDVPVPAEDDGRLFVVGGNVEHIASGYQSELRDVLAWLALREVAHHIVFVVHPWVPRYYRSTFQALVDSIEIDVGDLERRIAELQSGGMQELGGLPAGEMLPVMDTERHRVALDRLQAFIAVFEGYAAHCSSAVADEVVPGAARIEEAMTRRAATGTEGKAALTGILGLKLDRHLIAAAETFCAAVVKLRGVRSLDEVWAAPDNLPSMAEIRDPFAWIERVLPPN